MQRQLKQIAEVPNNSLIVAPKKYKDFFEAWLDTPALNPNSLQPHVGILYKSGLSKKEREMALFDCTHLTKINFRDYFEDISPIKEDTDKYRKLAKKQLDINNRLSIDNKLKTQELSRLTEAYNQLVAEHAELNTKLKKYVGYQNLSDNYIEHDAD